MFAAIFNRDAKKSTYLLYPELYKDGQVNSQYNIGLLGWAMLEAICHSLVLYYISSTWYTDVVSEDGTQNDVWVASSAMYTWLVVLVNYKIALLTTTWPAISKWFLFLSILAWFVFALIYNVLDITPNYYYVAFRTFGLPSHWLFSILIPIACLIPSFCYR
jgi:phospholipid-translocating ATPase